MKKIFIIYLSAFSKISLKNILACLVHIIGFHLLHINNKLTLKENSLKVIYKFNLIIEKIIFSKFEVFLLETDWYTNISGFGWRLSGNKQDFIPTNTEWGERKEGYHVLPSLSFLNIEEGGKILRNVGYETTLLFPDCLPPNPEI